MTTRPALVLLVACACFTLPPRVMASSSGPTLEQTRLVLQSFFDAYNRHDMTGVLATLGTQFTYTDCDYVWDAPAFVFKRAVMKAWLRARFAEHDRFDVTQIAPGGVDTDGDFLPNVADVYATRTNDILQAQGLPPQRAGAKIIVDGSGRVERVGGITAGDCAHLLPPAGPNVVRTRGIVQALLDAYNAHDLGRALEMATRRVTYRDCDYASGKAVTLRGIVPLSKWFRARFKEGDSFGQITIAVGDDGPNVALVQAIRRSSALDRRGLVSDNVQMTLFLGNRAAGRITRVAVVSNSGCLPSFKPSNPA